MSCEKLRSLLDGKKASHNRNKILFMSTHIQTGESKKRKFTEGGQVKDFLSSFLNFDSYIKQYAYIVFPIFKFESNIKC